LGGACGSFGSSGGEGREEGGREGGRERRGVSNSSSSTYTDVPEGGGPIVSTWAQADVLTREEGKEEGREGGREGRREGGREGEGRTNR